VKQLGLQNYEGIENHERSIGMEKQLVALNFALGMEKEGKAFFEKAAGSTKNAGARQSFTDLALMEAGHIAYIKANIASLSKDGSWMVEPSDDMDQAKMGKSVFRDRGEGKGPEPELAIGERTSDLSAVRIALAIENDLYEFYKRAAEHSNEPEAKAVFTKLSKWEKGHRELLEAQYDDMKEGFWSEMGFSPF
jgi:rubrerythrin